MAAHEPKQPQSPGEPEPEFGLPEFGLPAFAREGKGGPEVVVLGFEPVHPRYLLRSHKLRLRFLGEEEEVLGVRLLDLPSFAALFELLPRVLVDGFEHHEAGFVFGALFLPEEALLQQRGDAVEDVDGQVAFRVADGLYGLQGPAPREDREPGEEGLLALLQQVVAPFYGPPERALARGQVFGSAREELGGWRVG